MEPLVPAEGDVSHVVSRPAAPPRPGGAAYAAPHHHRSFRSLLFEPL